MLILLEKYVESCDRNILPIANIIKKQKVLARRPVCFPVIISTISLDIRLETREKAVLTSPRAV